MITIITINLTPQDRVDDAFALGFAARGVADNQRGDYAALAEKLSLIPADGNISLEAGEVQIMTHALETTVHNNPGWPASMTTRLTQLQTHLRTSQGAHAAGAAHETTTSTGARSGP